MSVESTAFLERLAGGLPLPDIWGEGAIFAFSGIDGPTCSLSNFVAAYDRQPYDLLIHTASPYRLQIRTPQPGAVTAATNDLLLVDIGESELAATFSAWHTLIGRLPPGGSVALEPIPPPAGWGIGGAPGYHPQSLSPQETVILERNGERFAAAYGETPEIAAARAHAGLQVDLLETVSARLAFLKRIPCPPDPGEARFMRKCASVIKVNTLAPEGPFTTRWSTPDRVPHQHLWLWDSVFHSFAMNRIDPQLAWELLWAVLQQQLPDGMIPHFTSARGAGSQITQPPLLAWGIWENYRCLPDREHLELAFPRLEAYLAWNLAHRDRNMNHLLEWLIEADRKSRSGESGMDNSPRFDDALVMDAVDFSSFQAQDMACLANIAAELGKKSAAGDWLRHSQELSRAVHAALWDKQSAFYLDRELSGAFSPVRAISGFLPLLLEDIPAERVDLLLQALEDPAAFGSACPIPSVALDTPAFSTDMWRGAAWINYNYLVITALRRQGRSAAAGRLAQQTLALVRQAYEQHGVLFEFFDASGQIPPSACDRKGPLPAQYDIRQKYSSIRDYHWTAALCFALLSEASSR